jgi:hypothetical protein
MPAMQTNCCLITADQRLHEPTTSVDASSSVLVVRVQSGGSGSATTAASASTARRRHGNTPEEDCILCGVIVAAVAIVIARFVYLFHDRIRNLAAGEDSGGAGCYQMMWHTCTFETEVCCPEGCAAAGGLWVDGGVRALPLPSCSFIASVSGARVTAMLHRGSSPSLHILRGLKRAYSRNSVLSCSLICSAMYGRIDDATVGDARSSTAESRRCSYCNTSSSSSSLAWR